MLVQLISDLHLEFADETNLQANAADIVVLAGDIHMGELGVKWAAKVFSKPVLYIIGNHEYYEQVQPDLVKALKKQAAGTNVTVLENDCFEFNDRVFLGATLWTDFNLYGSQQASIEAARTAMFDYRQIQMKNDQLLQPEDTLALHQQSRRWLEEQLRHHAGKQIVVITHHGPSPGSIAPCYIDNPLNPAFVSDLDDLIAEHEIVAWLHGHTHVALDYYLGKTRVVCNPRGYQPYERSTGFMPHKCIAC